MAKYVKLYRSYFSHSKPSKLVIEEITVQEEHVSNHLHSGVAHRTAELAWAAAVSSAGSRVFNSNAQLALDLEHYKSAVAGLPEGLNKDKFQEFGNCPVCGAANLVRQTEPTMWANPEPHFLCWNGHCFPASKAIT